MSWYYFQFEKKNRLNLTTNEIIIIAVGFIIITILGIISFFNEGFANYFSISRYFGEDAVIMEIPIWEGLLFCALCTTIGALIPVGTPYVLPIMVFQYNWYWYLPYPSNILWIWINIMVCLVVTAICDMIGYWIGRGINKYSNADYKETKFSKFILKHPKLTPLIIILINLLPISDVVLYLPLGMIKYPFWKLQLWDIVGELIMFIIVSLIAIYGFQSAAFILELDNWVFSIIVLYIAWIIVAFSIKYT